MTPFDGLRRRLLPLATFVVMTTGCYATVRSDPVYAEAYHEPPRVYAMPRSHYEGRVVYLVDDRWYFYDRGHWFFYTAEPRPLYEQRLTIRERRSVRQAPPAHPRRYYRPPRHRHRYESAPAYVPPARRVD
jgi:hypothetical protein